MGRRPSDVFQTSAVLRKIISKAGLVALRQEDMSHVWQREPKRLEYPPFPLKVIVLGVVIGERRVEALYVTEDMVVETVVKQRVGSTPRVRVNRKDATCEGASVAIVKNPKSLSEGRSEGAPPRWREQPPLLQLLNHLTLMCPDHVVEQLTAIDGLTAVRWPLLIDGLPRFPRRLISDEDFAVNWNVENGRAATFHNERLEKREAKWTVFRSMKVDVVKRDVAEAYARREEHLVLAHFGRNRLAKQHVGRRLAETAFVEDFKEQRILLVWTLEFPPHKMGEFFRDVALHRDLLCVCAVISEYTSPSGA